MSCEAATIPIWINNRNRLTTTRAMVAYCENLPGAMPIIFDNASVYPPLIEWYYGYQKIVIRSQTNRGPWAVWESHKRPWLASDYYVVTDSDLDLSGVPFDVLDKMRECLDRHPNLIKVGLSLEINDLPSGLIADYAKQWEGDYWTRQPEPGWWDAPVDTTFAMYRAGWHCASSCTSPAWRMDRPYTARHIPWYRVMDDEERYIEAHADLGWSMTANFWKDRDN